MKSIRIKQGKFQVVEVEYIGSKSVVKPVSEWEILSDRVKQVIEQGVIPTNAFIVEFTQYHNLFIGEKFTNK